LGRLIPAASFPLSCQWKELWQDITFQQKQSHRLQLFQLALQFCPSAVEVWKSEPTLKISLHFVLCWK
jgi:hypothetical protein